MKKFVEIFKRDDVKVCDLPFGSDECGKFLRSTYKDSVDDTVILDESLYDCFLDYDFIVGEINKLEVRKKVIEHRLQSELKNFEVGFCKERRVTWKSVSKSTIDSKRLKSELPDIAGEYMKSSVSRVFKVK